MTLENYLKWKDKVPHDEMGWKGALCELIHPIVMGNVMCNESSQEWEE